MASSFGVSGVVTALVGEGKLLVAVSTRRVDFIGMRLIPALSFSFTIVLWFDLFVCFMATTLYWWQSSNDGGHAISRQRNEN